MRHKIDSRYAYESHNSTGSFGIRPTNQYPLFLIKVLVLGQPFRNIFIAVHVGPANFLGSLTPAYDWYQ